MSGQAKLARSRGYGVAGFTVNRKENEGDLQERAELKEHLKTGHD